MEFWRSVNGMVTVKLLGANIPGTLSQIHRKKIVVYNVRSLDEMNVTFALSRQDLKKLQTITDNNGDVLTVERRLGLYWKMKAFLLRPVMVFGIAWILAMVLFIPTRIFFFRVEGNVSVPTQLILEEAEKCGIYFGASRAAVRSERTKNALLEAMPQLQWAGVNTAGCVVTITVREREAEPKKEINAGVSSLVATRDGVILSCTATRGNLLCRAGQAVKAGDVLISGYTDCGLSIRATNARGEVYARTQHNLTVHIMEKYSARAEILRQETKYSIIIGKNRINFFKDSGILPDGCVKMYSQKQLTLPGGFALPVILVTEVWTYYVLEDDTVSEPDALELTRNFSQSYLQSQMVAGQILSKEESLSCSETQVFLSGQYGCMEMIARIQNEEIIAPNGKND